MKLASKRNYAKGSCEIANVSTSIGIKNENFFKTTRENKEVRRSN